MSTLNLDQLGRTTEELIRAGKRDEAKALLNSLKGKTVPRSHATRLATFARRVGSFPLGLQFLSPIVRPKVAGVEASNEEKAAYSLLLLGLGANAEAFELLQSCDKNNSDVSLSTAFAHMKEWDYSSATTNLKRYLKTGANDEYQGMVAKVNLAASYVGLRSTGDADPLLQEILEVTKAKGWNLLHKNALELSAQVAIQRERYQEAQLLLDRALANRENQFNIDDFFVRKWKAISSVLEEKGGRESLRALEELREEARRNNHWETVRDCDLHRAIATFDDSPLLNVYFGTPFPKFRERLLAMTSEWIALPREYVWNVADQAAERVFDLRKAEEVRGTVATKAGKGIHVALQTLTSDFYRPFLVGNLHSRFFPGEHFNPTSSPRRVAFLIHRLREWFDEHDVPLAITADKEGYQLSARGPYAFLISGEGVAKKDEDSPAHYLVMLGKLRESMGAQFFSAPQIATKLEISERSARYFTKWALESKKLRRTGTGKATRYKLNR